MQRIARTKGETRTHLYDERLGYPVRICNWALPKNDFIDNGDAPFCKYCRAYQEGKRRICFAPVINP
ncbi:hypothetical protein LCGC14_1380030 [marine sediment metagenome]|uniref:Uncharacterized protein n=1 Tax=marine sediment metagenome TaxID=412755 RepID=A0A0F9N4M0_9ZZZZ